MKRRTRTLWVYLSVGIGTVVLAFLCVLLSGVMYMAGENALYNKPKYEVVNIISSERLGEPLSLVTRLNLYDQCQIEGEGRLPLPEEASEDEVTQIALNLWNEALMEHADQNGVMPSGDLVSDLMGRARTTAVLRDFYNENTNSKLALWCVQVYCNSGKEDETYCVSIQFDSCTAEPYSLNCALFSNVLPENNRGGIESFCTALGIPEVDVSGATIDWQQNGAILRLTLSSGIVVQKDCNYGSQYTITLINPY